MYNGGKIIIGLIIFLGFSTLPFLFTMGKAIAIPEPKLDTPEIQRMVEKKCVESKEYMKTEHMVILNDWRDAVVRDGAKLYKARDGKMYDMSLQNTCMKCHSSKKNFCDQCHNYVAVKPYCWDCHIAPQEGT